MKSVPSSETLRETALRASWRRDRRVRLRRLAWRWVEWFATRWMLPVAAAAALGHVPATAWQDLPVPAPSPTPDGLHLSPALGPASRERPPRAADPERGISLKPEFQFTPKENK